MPRKIEKDMQVSVEAERLTVGPLTSGGLKQWITTARDHELNAVATLRLLLETCNVSETARQLNTSQPTVSRILERMRHKFGDPLLIKSANLMLRSKRAISLIPILDEILAANYRLYHESMVFNPALEMRTFTIGASDSMQSIIANNLLSSVRIEAPNLVIRMEPVLAANISTLLTDGRIDLIVGLWSTSSGDFRTNTVAHGDIVCLASRDNPIAKKSMSMIELAKQAFVEVSPSGFSFMEATIDDLFIQHGLRRQKVAVLSSYLAIPSAIAATDFFCFVPRLLLSQMLHDNRVVSIELDFTSPRHAMTMYWHNIAHTDPGQIWLRQKVSQVLRAAANISL